MIYESKLSGQTIRWPNGKPKDSPQPPQTPEIVAWLVAGECTCKVGYNCFEVVNKFGDALEVSYGASLPAWQEAIAYIASYKHE